MIKVDEAKCIGCGKCVGDCVAQQIYLKDGKAAVKGDCFLCGHCVAICPSRAVSIPEYDMEDVEDYDKDTFTLNPQAVLHSLKFRRSVRDYKNISVEQEKLNLLLQAGRYIETMAISLGLGCLYNGYLSRIADENKTLKSWLGIEGKTIKACLLLGYPNVFYERTAPRKEANVIWK